jgi:hypothetical protein
MEVLVDYNNLRRQDLVKGPKLIIDKVLGALSIAHLTGVARVNFRLYDGWYQDQFLTRRAQDVSTEVLANYPSTYTVTESGTSRKIVVTVELAYSLKSDPGTHVWHTYRMRTAPRNLSCADPAVIGCAITPCDLSSMYLFFRDKKCPNSACRMEPQNLINRGEQKLVDGMLSSDLYYLHRQGEQSIVVVSSDDDMWPAIRTVLDLGMHVIHVHPLPGYRVPSYYSRGRAPRYTELDM